MQQASSLALAVCSIERVQRHVPAFNYPRPIFLWIEEILPVTSVTYRRTFAEILAKQLLHAFGILAPSRQDF